MHLDVANLYQDIGKVWNHLDDFDKAVENYLKSLDINLKKLYEFHISHGRLATLTSVQIPGRYGNLDIKNYFRRK